MANRLVITLLVYEPCRSETRVLLCLPTVASHPRSPENASNPGPRERPGHVGRGRPTAPMGRPGPAGRWRGFREHTIRLSAFPPERRPDVRVRGIIRAVQSFKSGPVSSELLRHLLLVSLLHRALYLVRLHAPRAGDAVCNAVCRSRTRAR